MKSASILATATLAFLTLLSLPGLAQASSPTSKPTSPPACISCDTCGEHAVILKGTTVIADHAFENCVKLKSVVIPASVATVGVRAFAGTSSLSNVTFDRSQASMLQYLSDYSFSGAGITSLNLVASGPNGAGILEWGTMVFAHCDRLESVHIGGNQFYIGNSAFFQCHKLSSVTFDSYDVGCIQVGLSAFLNTSVTSFLICPGLVAPGAFAYTPLQAWDEAHDFCAFTKEVKYPPAPDVCSSCSTCGANAVIPPGAIAINDYAFMNCDTVQSIVIPSSVQVIGHSAFKGAKNLVSVRFEGTPSINFIGDHAFAYSGIRSFNLTGLGNNFIFMARYSFEYARQLQWVHLSGTFVMIHDYQFYQCHALTSITFDAATTKCHYVGNFAFYNTSITALPICPLQHIAIGGLDNTPISSWDAATACASVGIVPSQSPTSSPFTLPAPTPTTYPSAVPTLQPTNSNGGVIGIFPTQLPTPAPFPLPAPTPTTQPTSNNVSAIRFAIGQYAAMHAGIRSTHKPGKAVFAAVMSVLALWMPFAVPTVWPPAPQPAQFGAVLEQYGFQLVATSALREDGDVAVWSSVDHHEHGHVQVYFEGAWYSDFKQNERSPWRHLRGSSVTIYRYEGL
jgi:hypothetical protein